VGSSLNQLTATCRQGLDDVVRVLEASAKGDLSERITAAYEGDFARLRDASNTTFDRLAATIEDTVRVLEAAAQGNLAERISADYEGEFARLKLASNTTLEKLAALPAQPVTDSAKQRVLPEPVQTRPESRCPGHQMPHRAYHDVLLRRHVQHPLIILQPAAALDCNRPHDAQRFRDRPVTRRQRGLI